MPEQMTVSELLTLILIDLYNHADGNTGTGAWELYDKYTALYDDLWLSD